MLNQGQLKALAMAAYDYFEAGLAGGAGDGIKDLVRTWLQLNPGDPIPPATLRVPKTAGVNDYGAINLGQLKTVAQPFYTRLIAAGKIPVLPWLVVGHAPADDYAVTNLGQAKSLFSFVLNGVDTDGDGMPDWYERVIGTDPGNSDSDSDGLSDHYEVANGLNPGNAADASADSDGDGLTNAEEARLGTNPQEKDSDFDGVNDNLDGWPNNPDLNPPRLQETRYAVIRLDRLNIPVDANVMQIGDGGQVLYSTAEYENGHPTQSKYWLWVNGNSRELPLIQGQGKFSDAWWGTGTVRLSPNGKIVAGGAPNYSPPDLYSTTQAALWRAPVPPSNGMSSLASPYSVFGITRLPDDEQVASYSWAECVNDSGIAAGRASYSGIHRSAAGSWDLTAAVYWPSSAFKLGTAYGEQEGHFVPRIPTNTDVFFQPSGISNSYFNGAGQMTYPPLIVGTRCDRQISYINEPWVSIGGGAPHQLKPSMEWAGYVEPSVNSPTDANRKNQWVVCDSLWIQKNGQWQEEPFGDTGAGNTAILGDATGINDRCEIIGRFTAIPFANERDLIRNGQALSTNDLVSGYKVTNLISINNYGVILAGAKPLEAASASDPDYPVLLLPVEILAPPPNSTSDGYSSDLVGVSRLKIGKMESSLDQANILHIDKDPDRFFVKIRGLNHSISATNVKITISTCENPVAKYNDPPTRILMQADGENFVSQSLLLVADDKDDWHTNTEIGADELDEADDRTLKVQLGGKFKVDSITIDGVEFPADVKIPVPARRRLTANVLYLGAAQNSAPQLQRVLEITKERYGQVGIDIVLREHVLPVPANVDQNNLGQGLGMVISTDSKRIIDDANDRDLKTDVLVVVAPQFLFSPQSDGPGFSTFPLVFKEPADARYLNVAFVSASSILSKNRIYTLAHEIGHILTNNGHYGYNYEHGVTYAQDHNLMRGETWNHAVTGTSTNEEIGESKRLYKLQQDMFNEKFLQKLE